MDNGTITNFSTRVPDLPASRAYDPFGYLAATKFGNDFASCTRWLSEQGYGTPATIGNHAVTVCSPDEEWEEPVEFEAPSVPSFPVAALPGWLADMVTATAEETQTPPDLAAMLGMAAIAAAGQRGFDAEPRHGWWQPL